MPHYGALLVEIGAVLLGLGLLGRLSGRYGISPIPLYLLAGLAFGEPTGWSLVTLALGVGAAAAVLVRRRHGA